MSGGSCSGVSAAAALSGAPCGRWSASARGLVVDKSEGTFSLLDLDSAPAGETVGLGELSSLQQTWTPLETCKTKM